eukprot:CAMPEP_0174370634 /NCGR_PEP_ID=MMETSP0811_2-20130205/96812_1 /TAXON_ID=73025 ORGANISM="Eutreptiella gymnastica-like, Strain CCMP1594" /NCGR_SAMPLE_ID=MMETSP0811_2 /ASSEMBLY_ACC=CAM_ASM_000667 /LENGTH=37 /DNA_ID= /DNA_START= /DNA_END= /DNA_ORIENTATION=
MAMCGQLRCNILHSQNPQSPGDVVSACMYKDILIEGL